MASEILRDPTVVPEGFRLRKGEKWIPIVFGIIGTLIYAGLIIAGVFGKDYYRPRGQKERPETFFEEEIKDDVTYGVLVVMSALLGFMRAVFDDVAGPQWDRISNLHNTKEDANELARAYENENYLWATALGARLWLKTSDALMIYFSFTDLYIFVGGFIGNVLGGIAIYFIYVYPKLTERTKEELSNDKKDDVPFVRETTMTSVRSLVF